METLRALTAADLPACLDLAADRDWPREEAKWRFLLRVGSGFGAFDGERLVGTAIVTRFGDIHTVLSMVLVARSHGGRGLGRRVVAHALAFAGTPVASLCATPLGRPLYEKLGFREVGRLAGHFGVLTAPPSGATRPAARADRARLVAEDAEVFGADRSALWAELFDFAHEVRVAEGGFAASWRDTDRLVVGPVVADSVEVAKALIADVAGAGPARVDVADPDLAAWLAAHGMPARFDVARMVRGEPAGARDRLYAPVMQALG
ncbi:GNAT family N-acetyltransferase [Saccharothrix australiensis]|uniref:Acetyltransferase (GNAT) family protein n=1 Tax=Saccharothrix australiensis TaxID=2072 RepID=A0A495VXQ6_9PSEU|nr:GNAT family N-acetyltransferase [Saccharothrix australiensis]RKT53165.1 acetyltransferase (GNAT) family protein [Saccharothrix australiensis]